MQPTPDLGTMQVELARASSAVSRANLYAVDPYRSLLGALLDSIVAIEELIAGRTDQPEQFDGCQSQENG